MAPTVAKVTSDALGLPSSGRAELVEKLLASLAGESDPTVERAHLDEVRRRREVTRTGGAPLIDGEEAFRQVRAVLRQ